MISISGFPHFSISGNNTDNSSILGIHTVVSDSYVISQLLMHMVPNLSTFFAYCRSFQCLRR